MNQVNSKPVIGTQTLGKKILDFIIGFLGSIILVNIGIVLIAQISGSQPGWFLSFVWLWRLLIIGVAGVAFAKKRVWISLGIAAVILVQAFGM